MTRLTLTKTAVLLPLAAGLALSLSACVAPNPYASYPGYAAPQPQYAQPAYAQPQPAYAQPAYSQPAYAPQPAYDQGQSSYQPYAPVYGTIVAVQPIGGATSPSGVAGTVVGALVGGVLGNQVGRGHGRDAATVIGALGGAVAGNQLGQQLGQQTAGYRVDVQLNDGTSRSFDMPSPGDLRPGDRVRVDGGQLSRY
ncbi:glycine zipper 2TM domain-containing protein [Trinickia fusca]|uniref:Glycine zipper 2TM domain-containing protein n=1 Tax=Trinickia fusca TaxID=2419777 RepID=A0A494XTI8_9BURK|nr:glycine zipper 2TM domain-containing protein [Trinickia fusca]RKP52236.1 glycine zipper 2TM domain-containing protein [Trinickia fusca]